MRIGLFSDTHGHLRLLLHLIRNWQMAHGDHLDAALVAGDLGCYPDASKCDKATRRWIERDPEEAGFSRYFVSPVGEVERLFRPEFGEYSAIRCPVFFVPGNHEDFDYLKSACRLPAAPSLPQHTFPADCYKRFHGIVDGAVVVLRGRDGTPLRIAGIWGIENARAGAPYQINPGSAQRLRNLGPGAFDLLLTHDSPAGSHPMGSSALIAEVVRSCRPSLHVFGHVPPMGGRHEFGVPNSGTRSVVLKDVSFGRDGTESLHGAMGVLDWDGIEARFQIADDDWLGRMRFHNWVQVLPEPVPAS